MRVYTGQPRTLRDILEASRQFGDRDYLVYGDDRLTFADHYRLVAGLARCLRQEYGLVGGDRVAITMRNYPEWGPLFWAIQAAGLIAVPLNAWWTGPELRYAVADSGATLVFADAERVAILQPHLAELAAPVVEVRGGSQPPDGVRSWRDLVDSLGPDAELPEVTVAPEDDATILYTSGTTGRPKGAIGSHRNHCTNMHNTLLGATVSAIVANGGVAPDPPGPDEPQPGVLLTFPMFHIAGITMLCFAALTGTKMVTMYRWDADEARRLIAREQLASAAGVPTLMRQLVEAATEHPDDLTTLAGLSMGGAPIPPELVSRVDTTFASAVAPSNGYGLTETTSAVVSNTGSDYVTHPDSVGRCQPGADLRIVDPGTGADTAEGEIGELWFRGPNVVRGYWNNPDATAAAFTDGWFHTGDLGHVRNGWVYVVDRRKDVVIRGGENVYCVEVEGALFEHPDVADAAVVGLPHAALGEEVAAVLRLHDGATTGAEDLREHVATRLASFKVPSHVVFWHEPLPRTTTGKVLKRDLRDQIASTVAAG
ncbi:MAG: AMP-binding protein [Pseudonocardiaceae bacterium]|nr:AMP-binding protein [Pseudonocardiaceae bacterium]